MLQLNQIICGSCEEVLKTFPDESVDMVVTSPPYWGLRDYGISGQLGLEKTPQEYVAKLVEVFREIKRVLKKEGTCWLNLGDSYNGMKVGNTSKKWPIINTDSFTKFPAPGLKPKDLVGIPWRVAFALQADGWWLRQDIIWAKPNPMPESVTDRCTKAHEYIFLLAKSQKYYFDNEAIKENGVLNENRPFGIIRDRIYDYNSKEKAMGKRKAIFHPEIYGENDEKGMRRGRMRPEKSVYGKNPKLRNKRSVWTVTTKPFKGAHFATFPEALVKPCILAGCPAGGIVCDPFAGAGTTCVVAKKLGRNYIGIDISPTYCKIAEQRLLNVTPDMFAGMPAQKKKIM